jgi:ATP-dependent DNA ligase
MAAKKKSPASAPAASAPAVDLASCPITPPLEPMLAKAAERVPEGPFLYEPKWDGFRALVFRGDERAYVQSRDLKPLNRYFPELEASLTALLPARSVIDGEVVIAGPRGLDFDALQQRIHPAASRIAKLAQETPASFVAFDALALDGEDLRALPQAERRARLEQALAGATPPVHLTPVTHDAAVATEWLARFEGAGLDGVMAKPLAGAYQPGKRAMFKIKHVRSADCVIAGFRWHKQGEGTLLGSLLLGLYDGEGVLQHVGVTSAFTMARRKELVAELAPLRENAVEGHPWRAWASDDVGSRMPGAKSRWTGDKDLSWQPLRPERVCEVQYDHLQGDRFRHAAIFLRFRDDKPAAACRYDQLEVVTPYELARVFGGVS